MAREEIPLERLQVPVFQTLGKQWLLLTAGLPGPGQFNAMTISWGGLGLIWDRLMALVVVRPTRYTYQFMERADTFTLCTFPPRYHEALLLCGTKSGRDLDKIQAAGLTPVRCPHVDAPGYEEAELILECRKLYFQDVQPAHFALPELENFYPQKDYHRMYLGGILGAQGTAAYRGP